jgi:photosystem II stability/assembly factor-like uncharacterized protein
MYILRFVFVACLFLASAIGVFAQKNATNVPPLAPPFITAETPDWALEMYSDAPNVHHVDQLYKQFFAARPFEKTVDTRNYKHWRRQLSKNEMVQNDGSIVVPTDAEREVKTRDWLEKKVEIDQIAAPDRSPTSIWEQIGPFENTGTGASFTSVQSCQVAFSQCLGDLNVLYSVSQNGKIFKTINHGDVWTPVGENYFFDGDTWTEQCITVHPTNPNIVYYGSASKIWKTTDGGTTWTNIYSFSGLEPNTILIDPTTPNNVLICSEKGVFRSTDGGVIFNQVRAGVSWDIRFKTNNSSVVFGIFRNGLKSDFYKSLDGGLTWNPSITGWFALAQTTDSGGRMTVSTTNSNLIYCFIVGRVTGDNASQPIIGVAKSTDAGANWTQLVTWNTTKRWTGTGTDSVNINGGQGYYDLDIEVSDANDNLVFFGTQSDWTTTNGFSTVLNLDLVHADVQEIHFNGPNDMWVATDGGLDLLDANLTTNTPKSKGITGTEFWGFDQGWNEDSRCGSYYHNGTSGHREGYPNNQFRALGGAEPATGYINVGNSGKMWFSEVGGKNVPPTITGEVTNWTYGKLPNESANGQDERSEIVPHPQFFNTHFLGKDNVLWKTTDGGSTFSPVFTFGTSSSSIVTSIEIYRPNPQIMLVYQLISVNGSYTSGKIWKTTNGGTSFNEIVQPTGAPTSDGCFITLSPTNADHFWIAYNKTSTTNKVFKTTNGGTSWTPLTTSLLTGLRPNALLHIGGTDGGVYLMTPHSMFYRNNTHTDWQPFGNGLPAKLYNNYLRPYYKGGKIRMATVARGLWSVDFYENPTTVIAQATVSRQISDCLRDTFFFEDYSMVNHTGASWSWSFPGAATVIGATTRNPKVIYGSVGNFTATMTLTTPLGISTSSVTVTVNAGCEPDTVAGQVLRTAANGDKILIQEANLTNLTHFTVTGWWKPNGAQQAYSALFSSGDWCAHCDYTEGLLFDYDGNELWYKWPGNEGSWASSSGLVIPLNEWSYVALVIDPTGATMYLNGKKYRHNIALSPGQIENIHLGFGHYDKSFKGDIDEVTIWKRALSEAEVRRLRHITREDIIAGDPDLIGYWQFNEVANGQIQDNVGIRHGSLQGGASLAASSAPVGGGSAQLLPLSNGTFSYNFNQVGTEIQLSDCDVLAGSVVATRLNVPPNIAPAAFPTSKNAWFLNFYDGPASVADLENVKLTISDAPFLAGISTPNEAIFHARTVNGDAATWLPKAKGTAIAGSKITFNRKAQVTGDLQIGMTDGAPEFTEIDPGSPCSLTDGPKKSLRINGTANYARTNAAIPLGTSNAISIVGWIKPSGAQPTNAGIIFSASGGATGLNFRSANQLGYHWADDGGSYGWTGGPTIPADIWSHIALVVTANSATIYLNGVPFTRTAAHAAVNFSSIFHFGNDRGSSSRTMTGDLDELRFYNRSLSQNEIRELRHLTYPSYSAADASLLSYFKMNEATGQLYDRTGSTNATLIGTATRSEETGPFEKGISQRISVTTANATAIFDQANLNITFGANHPNGELCVSRIDSLPVGVLANEQVIGGKFWVINNHGSNNATLNVSSMVFSGINVNSTVPSRYKLYKRNSNAHLVGDWVLVDAADAVTVGSSGSITFSTGLAVNSFSQFAIFEKGVRVAAKVFLQGTFNTGTGLLNDNLRSLNLIPTAEPYANLGFAHVEGGGETVASNVFSTVGNNAIVDWVFLELRDKNNPSTRLFTRSALVQKDGDIVDSDGVSAVHFANAANDNYYLSVKHRNHLGVRSPAVLALSETPTTHDFTTSLAQTWDDPSNATNDAMVPIGSVFGLFRGNASANDRLLNVFDMLQTKTGITPNQANVYHKADLNLDGLLNVFDMLSCKLSITPNKVGHIEN